MGNVFGRKSGASRVTEQDKAVLVSPGAANSRLVPLLLYYYTTTVLLLYCTIQLQYYSDSGDLLNKKKKKISWPALYLSIITMRECCDFYCSNWNSREINSSSIRRESLCSWRRSGIWPRSCWKMAKRSKSQTSRLLTNCHTYTWHVLYVCFICSLLAAKHCCFLKRKDTRANF